MTFTLPWPKQPVKAWTQPWKPPEGRTRLSRKAKRRLYRFLSWFWCAPVSVAKTKPIPVRSQGAW